MRFQAVVKTVLVDGYLWNPCLMKCLGLVFLKKMKFEIFIHFSMFVHIWTSTRSGFSKKSRKSCYAMISNLVNYFRINFFKKILIFSSRFNLKNVKIDFYYWCTSKIKIPNVKSLFRFFGFCLKSLWNSLREWSKISGKQIFDKLQ